MIKVLIVDDEQSAIDILKDKIEFYDNYKVCGEALDVKTAVELTCIEKPDLVFLDVLLGSKTGFDYLNTFLPNIRFKVIFTTAYNEFAVKAFEFSALDYILKPLEKDIFEKALLKMSNATAQKQYLERLENVAKDLENNTHRFIFITTTEKVYKLEIKDLIFLEANSNYTTFHLANGKKVTTAKTLGFYQKQLSKGFFFRVHHSYLVNILKVKNYKKKQKEIILDTKIKLPVALRREKEFLEAWCNLKK